MTETNTISYDKDFYQWLLVTAKLLREKRFDKIDMENLIEEVEGLGRQEIRALLDSMESLIAKRLQEDFTDKGESINFSYYILYATQKLEKFLKDSPSLVSEAENNLDEIYISAVYLAVAETDYPKSTFPVDCPYYLSDLLKYENTKTPC